MATKWTLDRPGCPAILVGFRNANHVDDVVEASTSLMLSEKDHGEIEAVLARRRVPKGDVYTWERGGVW